MLFGNSGGIECCSCLLGTITNTDPAKSANQEPTISAQLLVLGLGATWRSSEQQKAASSAVMFCFPLFHTAQMCNCHCGDNIKTGIKGPRQIYGRIIKVVRAIGQLRVNCLTTSTLHIRHSGARTAFCRRSPNNSCSCDCHQVARTRNDHSQITIHPEK